MVTYNDIERLFSYDYTGRYSIEVSFCVEGSAKYTDCWMGRISNKYRDIFWLSLSENEEEQHEFELYRDMVAAPLFEGKSLAQLEEKVIICTIDGCEPQERVRAYMRKMTNPYGI